ncbi:MAG: cytochrome P450, partial [Desulfobulbia bacterium]
LLNVKDPITGQTMSDEQIVDNLLTFLLAGFDTTATALTWALYLLSRAPEWENRVQEEIFRVVPEGPVTSKHIDKLTVVQQVIKEAMRLYPSAPVLLRRAVNGCELGGKKIEAGVTINIPIYAIHRHRNLWKDPNRFDPSRFTFGSEANYSRYQFMPFGGGPRVCIGASFAHIEAVVILTTLVRSARFECPPDVEPQPLGRIILVPKGGMPLHVTMRV